MAKNPDTKPSKISAAAGMEKFQNSPLRSAYEAYNTLMTGELKIAADQGFEPYNTGGNIFCLRKERPNNEDGYWLISDENNLRSSAVDAVWAVGHYATFDNEESWVFVEQDVTLAQALEHYASIPLPQPDANGKPTERVAGWDELGIDFPAATGPKA